MLMKFNRPKTIALLMAAILLISLSGAAAQDGEPLSIVFMHHSTGEGLIWDGDVREGFTELGHEFWDHGYGGDGLVDPAGTRTGIDWNVPDDNTDPDGWHNVFQLPVTDPPTNAFSHMLQHDVILFKSCFPASNIYDEEMLETYREYYLDMRDVMDQHPDKLFIPFTPPPLVPNETEPANAARAQQWAEYLMSDEYLEDHPNVVVFDFFTELADEDGFLRAEYRVDIWDSHPNEIANQTVGPVLVEFVDQAIQDFTPGEAVVQPEIVETEEPTADTETDDDEGCGEDSEGEVEATGILGDTIEDFESPGFEDRWWDYADEGAVTFECEPTQPGYSGDYALGLTFDLPVDVYGGCGTGYDTPQNLGDAIGIRFTWRSDQPDVEMLFALFVYDPAQPDDPTPFDAQLMTPGEEWTLVELTWDDFTKPEWIGDTGVAAFDPAQIVGLGFDIGSWEAPLSASVWVDDIQLILPE